MFTDSEILMQSLGHISLINGKAETKELLSIVDSLTGEGEVLCFTYGKFKGQVDLDSSVRETYQALGVSGIKGEHSDFLFALAQDSSDSMYLIHVNPLTPQNKESLSSLLRVECTDYKENITKISWSHH